LDLSLTIRKIKISSNCLLITWDKNENCKSIECLFTIFKNFCDNGTTTIIARTYNSKYCNEFRIQIEKYGYKFRDVFTKNKSLTTYYTNETKKRLISIEEEKVEGIDGDREKTLYSIALSGKLSS
jgi:ribosomal protein S17E